MHQKYKCQVKTVRHLEEILEKTLHKLGTSKISVKNQNAKPLKTVSYTHLRAHETA